MKFRRPKGTKDVLPAEIHKWHFIEDRVRELMMIFNYNEIRTPSFEYTELFQRSVGTHTDIVGKEMYTFIDKGGESITLRPEGTASVARAFLENSMIASAPVHKLYYIANMFRHEKPQAGRYREHTQIGAEVIGTDSIFSDVELIVLASEIYKSFHIAYKLKINTIGNTEDRAKYVSQLRDYLLKYSDELSEDSRRRLDSNTLRILDSKDTKDIEITSSAPKIYEVISYESQKRFDSVINELSKNGIEFEVDFRLVRGLDYYCHTTFEFISHFLGAQNSIGGGGRYDGLFEQLGGENIPAAGFGIGVERLIQAAEKSGFNFAEPQSPVIYFAAIGEEAFRQAFELMNILRSKGISAETDYKKRSLKAQLRDADRLKVKYVYIIGDEELKNGKGTLKNMLDSTQRMVNFTRLAEEVSVK